MVLELDEKTAKMLEEDMKISKAMDDRKEYLHQRKLDIPKEINKLSIECIEVDRELKEYEEEY